MGFTLVQTVTDRTYNLLQNVVDRGVQQVEEGQPIGLLLAITYAQ